MRTEEAGLSTQVAARGFGAPYPVSRRSASRTLVRLPSFWLGLTGVALLLGSALFAPVITAHDPNHQDRTLSPPVQGPSSTHVLGTDRQGRDYFARLVYGARISLGIGIGANVLAVVIGVAVGVSAAYAGTLNVTLPLGSRRPVVAIPIESILMRATDVVLAFPVLLLALALVAIYDASFWLVLTVAALFLWTPVARVVHGRVLALKEREFVDAARALGVRPLRVVATHIVPHLVPVVLVYGALGFAAAILFEATLSFLGHGVPPPAPSWGTMIYEHIDYANSDPRLIAVPGLAILLTILSFNLLADALRTALDPVTSS